MTRYEKQIVFLGQRAKVACDGNCAKAWGLNSRPRFELSDDEDDWWTPADSALGTAPEDPGTDEGGHAKPVGATGPEHMNKWCVRECERCVMSMPGEADLPLELPDFSRRRFNRRDRGAP